MSLKSFFSLPTRIFGIDRRSLTVFRIVIALVLLSDLVTRALDIPAFYTDDGVLPRVAQIQLYSGLPGLSSFHLMSGYAAVQYGLFAVSFGAGLALLVGYHTRWATLVSWAMLVSLHNRNPLVVQGGDVLLRMMLFWSIFLPLGAYGAFDALLRRGIPDESRYEAAHAEDALSPITARPWLSVGTLAILLQLCFMYWFAVVLKTDASWRSEGTALYYALSIDQMVRPLGSVLLRYPDLLRVLTYLTLFLEGAGPLLALLPFWKFRSLMVFAFIMLHLMMGLCLTLGIFPLVAAAAWLLFLPGQFWDLIARRYCASESKLKLSLENARLKVQGWFNAKFPPLHETGLRATRSSSRARREYLMVQGVAAFFLIYIFCWNMRSSAFTFYGRSLPTGLDGVGWFTRTDQRWDMFAPSPLKDDGWFIVEAGLANGKKVDLLRDGAPLNWKKPPNLAFSYHDALWQKYLLNLWPADSSVQRDCYAVYVRRVWNDEHSQQQHVTSLRIIYMREDTPPPGSPLPKPQTAVLWRGTNLS